MNCFNLLYFKLYCFVNLILSFIRLNYINYPHFIKSMKFHLKFSLTSYQINHFKLLCQINYFNQSYFILFRFINQMFGFIMLNFMNSLIFIQIIKYHCLFSLFKFSFKYFLKKRKLQKRKESLFSLLYFHKFFL